MKKLVAALASCALLLLAWIGLSTLRRLEGELASVRFQVAEMKTGPQGPKGQQGQQGPQGERGDPGSAGTLSLDRLKFSEGKLEFQDSRERTMAFATVDDEGRGSFRVFNSVNKEVAFVGIATNGDGLIQLGNFRDSPSLKLVGSNVTGGDIWLYDQAGKEIVRLGTSLERNGFLNLSRNNKVQASIAVTGKGGFASFWDESGKQLAFIGADTVGNGSVFIGGTRVHDYAEVFELTTRKGVVPGTVMALADLPRAAIQPASFPYDRRVVGVISGAGSFQPGAVIGSRADQTADLPIAVAGQVYVRVCAAGGIIKSGDLLVASNRPGVAMRAGNPDKALGAVIGKALEPFDQPNGTEGLVRMLVMLR